MLTNDAVTQKDLHGPTVHRRHCGCRRRLVIDRADRRCFSDRRLAEGATFVGSEQGVGQSLTFEPLIDLVVSLSTIGGHHRAFACTWRQIKRFRKRGKADSASLYSLLWLSAMARSGFISQHAAKVRVLPTPRNDCTTGAETRKRSTE